MKDIQQLIKKDSQQGRYENIFPKTFLDAVIDKGSGLSLTEILSSFNMYFLSYDGSRESTRLQVPMSIRKQGLWVTYVMYDGATIVEYFDTDLIDDSSWSNGNNWRVGNNVLVGDVEISSEGNWVINGVDSKIPARGEKGITPLLRVNDNKLEVSYTNGSTYVKVDNTPVFTQFRIYNNKLQQSTDLGKTWINSSDYIAAWFRFIASTGENIGKIQISRDNGLTWSDLSSDFTNKMYIKGYRSSVATLPSNAVQGDIYGVGPTYDTSDTEHTNPIYKLYVRDTSGWVDNGSYNSISAGVVQTTGDSETEVMSQKAVSSKFDNTNKNIGILYKEDSITLVGNNKEYDFIIVKSYYIIDETEITASLGDVETSTGTTNTGIQIRFYDALENEIGLTRIEANNTSTISVPSKAVKVNILLYISLVATTATVTYKNIFVSSNLLNSNLSKLISSNITKADEINTSLNTFKTTSEYLFNSITKYNILVNNTFITTNTTPETIYSTINENSYYKVYVKSSEVSEDPISQRTGIYVYYEDGTYDKYYITPTDFNSGYTLLFNISKPNPTRIAVRTLVKDSNIEVILSILEVKDNKSIGNLLDEVDLIKKDLYEEITDFSDTVTTKVTTTNYINSFLYPNIAYSIYMKCNDPNLTNDLTGRMGLYFRKVVGASDHISYTVAELNKGLTVSYTPTEQVQVGVRTLLIGSDVILNIKHIELLGSSSNNSDWENAILATYGDSVTAINNGDWSFPYPKGEYSYGNGVCWGNMLASYYKFYRHYGRGIGGQAFAWRTHGGSVSFINSETGNYHSRSDSYNYDNYVGNVPIPEGCIAVRGCSCSWLRITSMFPSSIKDRINVVTIMFSNDAGTPDADFKFIVNDKTDPEWAVSSYYSTYGGDYNINTIRGGIASTIMKFQAWMPNTTLVLCTPISGKGVTGELNMSLVDNKLEIADIVKDMGKIMSIPVIDNFANCGINGINRTKYITDGVHPYTTVGNKMLAKSFIGGFKNIMNIDNI